jgi:hypothetical protein
MREINSQDVRVFVIWEPVLATDFVAPSTAALARISDIRAAQYLGQKTSVVSFARRTQPFNRGVGLHRGVCARNTMAGCPAEVDLF